MSLMIIFIDHVILDHPLLITCFLSSFRLWPSMLALRCGGVAGGVSTAHALCYWHAQQCMYVKLPRQRWPALCAHTLVGGVTSCVVTSYIGVPVGEVAPTKLSR